MTTTIIQSEDFAKNDDDDDDSRDDDDGRFCVECKTWTFETKSFSCASITTR